MVFLTKKKVSGQVQTKKRDSCALRATAQEEEEDPHSFHVVTKAGF